MKCSTLRLFIGCTVVLWAANIAWSQDEVAKESRGDLVLLIGSAGEAVYQENFNEWARQWKIAAERGGLDVTLLGEDRLAGGTLAELNESLEKQRRSDALQPLWLVLIGHGTFDGRSAKFNLDGTDLEPMELDSQLSLIKRPVAVIVCSSASGAFLQELSAPNRVVITSTKSGPEINYSRFGGYLTSAYQSLAADLDKDDQVSLLEAYLHANRQVDEYYKNDGQLATEHPLLDDNADRRGTSGEVYDGLSIRDEVQAESVDGLRAHQWHLVPNDFDRALSPEVLQQRNELEQKIADLKSRKAMMEEAEYYSKLEVLFVELATLLDTSTENPSSGF